MAKKKTLPKKSKDTLFVFLFGGPGTGKSTNAAGLFSLLKKLSVNAEYIQEYAKDKTWGEDFKTLRSQHYVTGKQIYRCTRLLGMVDVAVCDSAPILGLLYPGLLHNEHWEMGVVEAQRQLGGINIYLERNTEAHPYNPEGRNQTEDEAIEKDRQTLEILNKYEIPYQCVQIQETIIDVEKGIIYDPTIFDIYKIVRERMAQNK